MSIFRQRNLYDWLELSEDKTHERHLEEWIVDTWKQIPYPLNRHQLPGLPGLYALYGSFDPCHLNLPILHWQSNLTVGKVLSNYLSEEQTQGKFNAFLYIGTSQTLFQRWESHQKRLAVRHLFENGVGVNFYFRAMPPTKRMNQENTVEEKSRKDLEKELIQYLCPIFNDQRRWRHSARYDKC